MPILMDGKATVEELEKMRSKADFLFAKAGDITGEVKKAELNGCKLKGEVQIWFQQVENVKAEKQCIEDLVSRRTVRSVWVAVITKEIDELLQHSLPWELTFSGDAFSNVPDEELEKMRSKAEALLAKFKAPTMPMFTDGIPPQVSRVATVEELEKMRSKADLLFAKAGDKTVEVKKAELNGCKLKGEVQIWFQKVANVKAEKQCIEDLVSRRTVRSVWVAEITKEIDELLQHSLPRELTFSGDAFSNVPDEELEKMRSKAEALFTIAGVIKVEVENAELNGCERKTVVENWLQKVENVKVEKQRIESQVRRGAFSSRRVLVAKITKEIDELLRHSLRRELTFSGDEVSIVRANITSWEKVDLLGEGSFGKVYKAISSEGFFFAVKEISLTEQGTQGRQSVFQPEQEIDFLSRFEHENIVRYLGTEKNDSSLYIFLELVTQGSLVSLYKRYNLQDSQVSAYTRQILYGLQYLHDRGVVHRDIKCANILVAANGTVKLADFGLAKATVLNDLKSCKGTPFWMAPEVVNPKEGYGPLADIWSVGCTVLEMLTRHVPYHPKEPQHALYLIGNGTPPPIPLSLSVDAQAFIKRCLQENPSDRPSAADLLHDPFVLG